MWVYHSDINYKTNDWYTRPDGRPVYFQGDEITSASVFDEVRISCNPEADLVGRAHVYNAGDMLAQVGGDRRAGLDTVYTYRDDEPEVIEIRRRLAAGTIRRTYYDYQDHLVPEDKEFHSAHWLMELRHPFHTDNRHLFFEHFTRNLEYQDRTLHEEQLFRVPGIWRDMDPEYRTIRVHKRATDGTPDRPNVPYDGDYAAMVDAFAEQGWTIPIPAGFQQLYMFSQYYGEMTDGSPWWDPALVIQRTGITVSWPNVVRQLAAIYRAWEVENRDQDTTRDRVTKEWWKTWLGYAWELVAGDRDSIRVWNTANPRVAREIDGRTAVLEWSISHLQEWAARGVDRFRSDVNIGILAEMLNEPSLTHMQADGTSGETLVGLVPESDWERFQGRSYRTAANVTSTVTAEAGPDLTVDSGSTVVLDASATILDAFGDTTYLWERVDDGGTIGFGRTLSADDVLRPTVTPPSLGPTDDDVTLVYRLTVTNDGVSNVDEVTVTVRAPQTMVTANAGPDLTVVVNGTVEIVGTATIVNEVRDNTVYFWEKVSGEGSIHDPDSNSPEFTAPGTPGTTVYRVTVTNNGVSDTDTVTITITAA